MSRLYVVDGTFELFRCFHGAPRHQDVNGAEVGAARGLFWTLVKLLRRDDLTHVAFAFDRMAAPGPRDPDALLRRQNALALEVARSLGITVWPMIRYQADDALATAAHRYRRDVDQLVLCTADKDMMQCIVDDRVVLFDRIRRVWTDEPAMYARFGVKPSSWADYLALVGDPSDGLPGVPRWGAKATAILLDRYGHIEGIPRDPTAWDISVRGATGLAKSLAERMDEALLMRDLSILRTDMPLPQSIDDLRWSGPVCGAVEAMAARLEASEAVSKLSQRKKATF